MNWIHVEDVEFWFYHREDGCKDYARAEKRTLVNWTGLIQFVGVIRPEQQ